MDCKNADASRVICERILTHSVAGACSTVIVRMNAPVKQNRRWVCAYDVTGMSASRLGAGTDSFQAVQSALDGIRSYLEEQGGTFTGRYPANDAGFPRSIPTKYGQAFSTSCEKLIIDAEDRLLRDLKRLRAKVASAFGPIAYTRIADRKGPEAHAGKRVT